jgi:hypothetical protein
LTRTVFPIQLRRVHQTNPDAFGLQGVDRPIPAIFRFDCHLRFRAGVGDSYTERGRAVIDANHA